MLASKGVTARSHPPGDSATSAAAAAEEDVPVATEDIEATPKTTKPVAVEIEPRPSGASHSASELYHRKYRKEKDYLRLMENQE